MSNSCRYSPALPLLSSITSPLKGRPCLSYGLLTPQCLTREYFLSGFLLFQTVCRPGICGRCRACGLQLPNASPMAGIVNGSTRGPKRAQQGRPTQQITTSPKVVFHANDAGVNSPCSRPHCLANIICSSHGTLREVGKYLDNRPAVFPTLFQ